MNHIKEYLKVTVVQYGFTWVIKETSSLRQGQEGNDHIILSMSTSLKPSHLILAQGSQKWGMHTQRLLEMMHWNTRNNLELTLTIILI